jgi:hypothetical protein
MIWVKNLINISRTFLKNFCSLCRCLQIFYEVHIGGEHKIHVVEINNSCKIRKCFLILIKLNWVHLSLDFGEVIFNVTI